MNKKWHNCKISMPAFGVPVVIKLKSGLERVAYLDLTQTVGIYLWCCEELATFHSLVDVTHWQEWHGRGEHEVCPYLRES